MKYTVENGVLVHVHSLTSEFEVPEGVTRIASYAFWGCNRLIRITLPSTLVDIEDKAFMGNYFLVEIVNRSSLPLTPRMGSAYGNVAKFADHVITHPADTKITVTADKFVLYREGEDCRLVTYLGRKPQIVVPHGVTHLGDEALFAKVARRAVLPDTVQMVGHKSFYCSHIDEIVFPASVNVIGAQAFDCSDVQRLTIGASVVTFYPEIIDHAYMLTDLYFGGTQEQWDEAFDRDVQPVCSDLTVHFADGTTRSY